MLTLYAVLRSPTFSKPIATSLLGMIASFWLLRRVRQPSYPDIRFPPNSPCRYHKYIPRRRY
jgi:hypothetical protein